MSSALEVWSIEFNYKSAVMSCYDQIFLMHVKYNLFAW